MPPAVPKVSVQGLLTSLVTVRLSAKTTGALMACWPSLTVTTAPAPRALNVSLVLADVPLRM